MNPADLLDKWSGWVLPAPPWFIVVMKTIGFALHAVPMNLWYAGILVAMLLAVLGGEHGRRFSARLMRQMPVIIALGINFGIVPLLFIQVGYGSVFYPATILMAWPWFLVVVLLLPAYYGVYVYGHGLAKPGRQAVLVSPRCRLGSGNPFPAHRLHLRQCDEPDGEHGRLGEAVLGQQLPRRRHRHGAEHGRPAALAALAADVRPGPDDDGRLGRGRRRLVRPPRERRLSPLGSPLRLEALPAGHRLVRRRRQLVCLRHMVRCNERSDVPAALGYFDRRHRSGSGRGVAAAVAGGRTADAIGRPLAAGWASRSSAWCC